MARLGVNVDHVATVRQARLTKYPDPLAAALLCESAGADQITVHLREDRRHIQDSDLRLLRRTLQTELNLEMAATDEMVAIALDVRPDTVTFVPERRQELTTEGGLDLVKARRKLAKQLPRLKNAGIRTSLFIDPERSQIDQAACLEAHAVELHTGRYCLARGSEAKGRELKKLTEAALYGHGKGLTIVAGHGLNTDNISAVVAIPQIVEFNIGHSIIARAIFVGIERAVAEMLALVNP